MGDKEKNQYSQLHGYRVGNRVVVPCTVHPLYNRDSSRIQQKFPGRIIKFFANQLFAKSATERHEELRLLLSLFGC